MNSKDNALWILRGLIIAGALTLWEVLSRNGVLDRSAFPPMSTVVRTLVTLVRTSVFRTAMSQTLKGVGLAIVISFLISLPVGLFIGRSAFAQASSRLLVDFCQTIPAVALIPLFVLVYGSTFKMKVFLAVAAAVWPILIQTANGARNVDKVATDTLRAFQVTGIQRVRYLLIPSASPYIMTGLRICAVLSLAMITSGELLGDAPGLGHQLGLAQSSAAISLMWAYVVVVGALGVTINAAFHSLEVRLLRWHPSHRETGRTE